MRKYFLLASLSALAIGMNAELSNSAYSNMQDLLKDGCRYSLDSQPIKSSRGGYSENLNQTSSNGFLSSKPNLQISKNLKNPSYITAEGGEVYGYLNYTVDYANYALGLYELVSDGVELRWFDPLFYSMGINPMNGWYNNGNIDGITLVLYGGYVYGYCSYSIDFASGALLNYTPFDVNENHDMFYICTLNPDDNKIYGYSIDFITGDYYWSSASVKDPENVTKISGPETDYCYSLCFNPYDSEFYGMTVNQEFVRISTDGTREILSSLQDSDNFATFISGLTWNPIAKLFYWNANMADESSRLYTISPEGDFNFVMDYEGNNQFSFFFTTDESVNPNKPLSPTIDSITFVDGSLEGNVRFILPSLFGDERPLPTEINYTAILDDMPYMEGTSEPGTFLDINYKVEDNGFHSFGLYVSANGMNSATISESKYIGDDIPLSPTNVVLSSDKVSWDAVNGGVNGGYVDLAAIEYEVYINGDYYKKTSNTEISITLPSDVTVTKYVASVAASCNGLTGARSSSNKIIYGAPYIPPVTLLPTYDQFEVMTVYDGNADNSTWYYNDRFESAAIDYSYNSPVDDYLFLPPIKFDDASLYYKFSLESGIRSFSYPNEYLEVVLASNTNPDSIIKMIIDPFTPTTVPSFDGWTYMEGYFNVPEEGIYNIGIHCMSEQNQYGMYAKNFILQPVELTGSSPLPVSDLNITAGEEGALEATISFRFPERNLSGEEIPSSSTLTAIVGVNGIKAGQTEGFAGKESELIVPTNQGTNTLTITIYNDEIEGISVTREIYTGVYIPASPINIKGIPAADMMSAVLTWDPVTTAHIDGGYVNPDEIYYNVWLYVDNQWEPFVEGLSETTYTFELDYGDPQAEYMIGISSENEAGSTGKITYTILQLGTPYTLPMYDKIYEEGITIKPWVTITEFDNERCYGEWYMDYLSNVNSSLDNGDNLVIIGTSGGFMSTKGVLGIPRFSTLNIENAILNINVLTGAGTPSTTIYGGYYGCENWIEIGKFEDNKNDDPQFVTLTFTLPDELMNKNWVGLYILSEYSDYNEYFIMDNLLVDKNTTGISEKNIKYNILTSQNKIIITNLEGKEASINTLDGKTVFYGKIKSDNFNISVESGLYIVKVDNLICKVLVK